MAPRLRQHVPGLMYTGLVMVVAIMAMNNQNNLMFWMLGALLAALIVSALISAAIVRPLRIRRIDPRHGTVGEPLIVRYAVRNRSRWLSLFNLHAEELLGSAAAALDGGAVSSTQRKASAWLMHVGPRETVHGEAIFWPQRRGRIVFDRIRVWTTFPFGIIRKFKIISQPQHTLIYPMMYELRPGLLRALAPKEIIGTKISHHAGAGDDFYGTREYRPGDSMRHIAWRRTAHVGELVVIDRTSPSPARLRVILDLTVSAKKESPDEAQRLAARELEERAITLAASLLRAADLDGYEIGLTMLGLEHPPIAIRRNQWHFHKIMAALAGLDLDQPRLVSHGSLPGVSLRDAERAALVVIAPDRVRPLPVSAHREDVLYLSARQFDEFAIQPIGSEGGGRRESQRLVVFDEREAAA